MGGGGIIGGKNFFGPNFVFLCLWSQHPFLHKTKGPTRNPISPTPPPPSAGVHVTPTPQSNFQVAQSNMMRAAQNNNNNNSPTWSHKATLQNLWQWTEGQKWYRQSGREPLIAAASVSTEKHWASQNRSVPAKRSGNCGDQNGGGGGATMMGNTNLGYKTH